MAIREQTKEQIVLLYFLQNGNEWASADAIVRWSSNVGVLKDSTVVNAPISRAGAVKICKRLVPDILESLSTTGYRSKKVVLYRLAENKNGYAHIAQRLNYSPMLFLNSAYGKAGIANFVIPTVESNLSISLGPSEPRVTWALSRSPTALMMSIDAGLANGDIAKIKKKEDRVCAFIEKLRCAVQIDLASQNRGILLSMSTEDSKEADKKMIEFFKEHNKKN